MVPGGFTTDVRCHHNTGVSTGLAAMMGGVSSTVWGLRAWCLGVAGVGGICSSEGVVRCGRGCLGRGRCCAGCLRVCGMGVGCQQVLVYVSP